MKKVIVTGGAGFIGSHTVIELIKAGYDPIIVDNFSNSEEKIIRQIEQIAEREIEVHNIDCKNEQQLSRLFILEGKIDGVIHFAAHKAVGESVEEPLKYYKNNLGSLINLLGLMKSHEVKNLVFSSSCTVYGEPDNLVVNENSPRLDVSSPYGNTKRICEDIIVDKGKSDPSLKSVILRYFNPIGAHPSGLLGELPVDVPDNLVPYLTQTAAGIRETLTVFGNDYKTKDGTCIRDYIHVVDLARAHVRALQWMEQKSNTGVDIFNLGTGNGSTVKEVIDTFEKVNGIKVNWKFGPRRAGDIESIYANVDKANKELNWKTEKTLSNALEDAWRWQQYLKENW